MTVNKNEAIITKIKGLLAIANDEKNDEESQSAFILAQKLMMKHSIDKSQVIDSSTKQVISNEAVTVYKQLHWWERQLASIIAKNFKVKWYYDQKTLSGERRVKRRITFLGFPSDIELAKEMFILAYDVIVHYAKSYVDEYYKKHYTQRTKENTMALKNSYMRGFLHGMDERFEEQVTEMEQEYGLMVLVPVEVEEKYDEMFKNSKGLSYSIPRPKSYSVYQDGLRQGKSVDYAKSTLDDSL